MDQMVEWWRHWTQRAKEIVQKARSLNLQVHYENVTFGDESCYYYALLDHLTRQCIVDENFGHLRELNSQGQVLYNSDNEGLRLLSGEWSTVKLIPLREQYKRRQF